MRSRRSCMCQVLSLLLPFFDFFIHYSLPLPLVSKKFFFMSFLQEMQLKDKPALWRWKPVQRQWKSSFLKLKRSTDQVNPRFRKSHELFASKRLSCFFTVNWSSTSLFRCSAIESRSMTKISTELSPSNWRWDRTESWTPPATMQLLPADVVSVFFRWVWPVR